MTKKLTKKQLEARVKRLERQNESLKKQREELLAALRIAVAVSRDLIDLCPDPSSDLENHPAYGM